MKDPYEMINEIAFQVMAEHQKAQPELFASYRGDPGDPWLEETRKQLIFLFDAASFNTPALFLHYVAWAKIVMLQTGAPLDFLTEKLKHMKNQCREQLEGPFADKVVAILETAMDEYPKMSESLPPFIDEDEKVGRVASSYLKDVLEGERQKAKETIEKALEEGLSLKDIYLKVFQSTQYEVGRLWQVGLASVAQEHNMTEVTQQMMAQLMPGASPSGQKKGKVVVTSVGNEMHEMGPRMVADFLEMEGWDVIFLGANTPHQDVIKMLRKHKSRFLLVSATMMYNVRRVKSLISQVRADPKLKDVKVMVGGYPFNNVEGLWSKVGADAYAQNAEVAVSVMDSF